MHRLIAASLLSTLLAPAGCDLALLPETADYVGTRPADVMLQVDATAMPSQGNVDKVEIELVEILVHRSTDDAWVLLGADEVELVGPHAAVALREVPLSAEHYDAVALGIDRVRVHTSQGWQDAELVTDTVQLDATLSVTGDTTLELHFDLDASVTLVGEQWYFDPVAAAELQAR